MNGFLKKAAALYIEWAAAKLLLWAVFLIVLAAIGGFVFFVWTMALIIAA